MKLKYIYISLLSLGLLSSCDKYLDVEPKGIIIPNKLDDYDKLLNSPTTTNSFSQYLIYASDDIHTDFTTNAVDPKTNIYFWKTILDTDNDASPVIWTEFYRQIYNANIIINNVGKAVDGSESRKNQLLAEALTNRAEAHFNLLTAFSKAYDDKTAGSLPGIPWVTYTDVTNKTPSRSTLQATLNLIIKDLQYAEGLLSNTRLNKTRVNKAVASAVLTRVYLYMGNYEEVAKYAELALKEPHSFRNYNDYFSVYEFPSEETDPEILWLRASTDDAQIYYLNYANDLLNLYGPDDLRGVLFPADYYGLGWYMKQTTGWGNFGISFMEMKLSQAEALAHQNKLTPALAIINEIRELRTAADAFKPFASGNKEEVIKAILLERRKELAFGSNRWMDMKRLAKQGRGSKSIRQSVDFENLISIDPNSFEYTFEIPSRVLMFNPDMQKNF